MKKMILVFILALQICVMGWPSAMASGTLVGAWSFDEGSGSITYDSSPNALNGNLSGHTWTSGKYGSAPSFTGTDKITFGNGAIGAKLSGAGAVTMAMWAKRSVTTSINFVRVFINTTNAGISVSSDASGLRLGARSVSSDSWQSKSFVTDAFKLNEWHHIAGVVDFQNKTMEMFLDGVSLGIQTVTLSANAFTLAAPTVPDEMSGANMMVDESKIYTGKLSASEIAALMQAGMEGSIKYYQNDTEQTAITPGNITAKLSLKNNTDQSVPLVFITAVFTKDTNMMDSCVTIAETVAAGAQKEIPITVSVPQNSGDYYIHSYVWNNMEEMVTVLEQNELN